MKYLEAKLVETDTIEHMYGKLVVLMNHLADELKPVAMRQGRRFSMNPLTPSRDAGNVDGFADQSRQGEGGDGREQETDSTRMMEINVCGNLSYYIELLEQGAEFFSVRDVFDRVCLESGFFAR